jgi:hypothetical protein
MRNLAGKGIAGIGEESLPAFPLPLLQQIGHASDGGCTWRQLRCRHWIAVLRRWLIDDRFAPCRLATVKTGVHVSPGRLTSLLNKEQAMGKYFLAWILGVPAFVLVLIYFFVH